MGGPWTIEIGSIPEGPSVLDLPDGPELLVYRSGREIRACSSRCRHMGGTLTLQEGTATARCNQHGWCLNLGSMSYVNPAGLLSQPEFVVHVDGASVVLSPPASAPAFDLRAREVVAPGELTIDFWTHACCVINAGPTRLVTDPWLVGPAFSRGWWLQHSPPSDWLERLTTADAIYVSHNHSDHLSPHTLRLLVDMNPDMPFIVPRFESESVARPLRTMGFRNVEAWAPGAWHSVDDALRLMIIPDGAGREDSGLLVDYRGHLILDTVDCTSPLGFDLPAPVDVWMGAFAGGASGFPICWTDQYGEEGVRTRVDETLSAIRRLVTRIVATCQPTIAVPFAGYFSEAHPSDSWVAEHNKKNDWNAFDESVWLAKRDTVIWHPTPSARLDVGATVAQRDLVVEQDSVVVSPPERSFQPFLAEIARIASTVPTTDAALQQYFEWAGFRSSLTLHIIETDESFEKVERERFIDLATGEVSSERPTRDRYIRMRVRSDVFRWALATGASWEEISIGFQARFARDPDRYELDFWDHFQNRLPVEPPHFREPRPPAIDPVRLGP